MNVLVINCGSSSIKFQLINVGSKNVLISGRVDEIGSPKSYLKVGKDNIPKNIKNHEEGVHIILDLIKDFKIDAIGHRVVHGAEYFKDSVLITSDVIKKIEKCSPLAPLHNPANLIGIKLCKKFLPKLKQVAVFDTAFHQTIPSEAYTYGLPLEYYSKYGVRKYGFHGPSHEYISLQVAQILKKKTVNIISCHLGNGASITAIQDGKSIDTTMGFTPISGLVMGTRCGDMDVGIIPYLSAKLKKGLKDILIILNKESGLKGISGVSDVRTLREGRETNPKFELALDVFTYKIALYIGAYVSILPSVDAITFTAGIGENEAFIREKIVSKLKGLGLKLDKKKNDKNEILISAKDSKIKLMVIPTNEELMIAEETKKVLK
jgi:acetate kinase